jgi:RND family efflux transporter MFP subunit
MITVRTKTIAAMGGAILFALLVLLVAGAVPRIRASRALAAAAEGVGTAVPDVYVIQPQPAGDTDLSLAATTQAFQDATIYARTSGYLSRRLVDIGDRVRPGQLLAEIASPEIDQQFRQAEADLRQSVKTLELQKATLDLARVTMGRYQAADAESAVAKEAVDQSVAAVKTAQAAVAAAEANVESNTANVHRVQDLTSFEHVVAPFAGTVIQRNVDVGALITAGSPTNNTAAAPTNVSGSANGLFEVAEIDALRVFVSVPQVFAPNVTAGVPVRVSVRGRLTEPVTGTVTRTANALDPGTRTLLVEVDIPNKAHQLLPGMFVYVGFTIGPSGTRWRVPATAVVFDADGTRVMTVGGGDALHFQPVVLGRDFGDSIEIQAGLHGGDTIVRQPTVSLQEGQVVRPITSAESGG